jgi:hypothetical protein
MPSKSIKAMVKDINASDADGGGLWLPNIQRAFVWSEEQIERLFDSIMRQYPLASMLIWKTRDEIKHRAFIQNFNDGKVNLKEKYQPDLKRVKRLVLDGQQRLQSLYLGLEGSIDGRILHFDLLSGDEKTKDEIRYRFRFIKPEQAKWPWVAVRSVVYTSKLPEDLVDDLEEILDLELDRDERKQVRQNISRMDREFRNEQALMYQELDNTYEDSGLSFEDVVEVFIRANSGGTTLSKSDLMFTLLATDWDDADVEMEDFLEEINDKGRFKFTRDFLIKLSMSILGHGAKYDVDKLRDEKIRSEISKNWQGITEALKFVKDEVVNKTYIRSDKALNSYNALIPLVVARFKYPKEWDGGAFLQKYLVRSLLCGIFSGHADTMIDRLVSVIDKKGSFNFIEIERAIRDAGRSLDVTSGQLLEKCGYGSSNIHLLFNLWYGREYKASSLKNEPQIDHLFARDILKKIKVMSSESGYKVQKYNKVEMDQLANCMLLPAHQNGAGDKSNKPLNEWLQDKDDEFLELHCIPKKQSLWEPENFEGFIEARKALILQKFAGMDWLDDDDE